MAQQLIGIGTTVNDGTGDTYRDAFDKTNQNFTELYGASSSLNPLSKLKAIFQLSDLPDPVASVITLDAGITYVFFNSVVFGSNRMVVGENTEITAIGRNIALIYTGSSDFITAVDVTFSVSNVTIVTNTTGAMVFSYSTSSLKIMRVDDCVIQCDRFADFSGVEWAAAIRNSSILPFLSGAITCSGTCRSFNWDTSGVIPVTGIIFDFGTCVFDSLVIEKVVYNLPVGTTFISGLANSGNIAATGRGLVVNCQGDGGGGTELTGITNGDSRWSFKNNTPIGDSREDFLISFEANATATTINTPGVYELVAGTWIEDHANSFTTNAAGRATYTGVESFQFPLDMAVDLEPVSGTNKDLSIKVAVNGTVVGPQLKARVDSGNPQIVNIPWQVTLENGHFVEVFVTNISDAVNVLVSAAIFRGN